MDRLANLSIGGKTLVGISVLIALGVSVVIASILSISRIERTLNEITDVAAPTVETTADVTYFVLSAHKIAIEILADEELADISARTEMFDQTVSKYFEAAQELDEIITDPDLQTQFDETAGEWNVFNDNARTMFNAHTLEVQEEQKARELLAKFEIGGSELIVRLSEIADMQENEMQAAEDRADELAELATTSAAQLNDLIGDLFEDDYPAYEAAMKLQFIIAVLEGAAREFMASEDPSELEMFRAEFTDAYMLVAPEFAILTDRAENATEEQQIASLKNDLDNWVRNAEADEQLFDTHRDMLKAELDADRLAEEMNTSAGVLVETLDAVAGAADAVSDGADEHAAELVLTAQITMAFLLIGMVAVGLVIAIANAKLISRPIRELTQAMELVSSGDLTAELPTSDRTHEIGKMTNAMVVFLENARKARDLDAEVKLKEEQELERQAAERAREDKLEKEKRAAEQSERQIERERLETLEGFQTDMERVLDQAASGDFTNRMSNDLGDASLAGLASVINRLLEATESNISDIVASIGELAKGNLGVRISGAREGSFERMQSDFNDALTTLSLTMGRVMESGQSVSSSSSALEASAVGMAGRAEKSAAAVEETSAAVEEITASIRQVVANARSADESTRRVRDSANKSRDVSDETEASMNAMTEASTEINRVVKVIEDIAFQINLLALNAGVEAARAGEAGRGFSVVASEVRALAQRSQEAVQEISYVIERNSQSVAVGVEQVELSRKALEDITSEVEVASGQISDIAAAVEQQSRGIEGVNTAIQSIDSMSQANAATLEEMTASSVLMSKEANTLADTLRQFTGVSLDDTTPGESTMAPIDSNTKMTQFQLPKAAAASSGHVLPDTWEEF